jgi:structure-specific recognition protein 1
VLGEVFSALTQKKLTESGSFKASQNQAGIKCSYKANEAFLFPLERSLFCVSKPPIFIPHNIVSAITFSRAGGGSTTKFFELRFNLENGQEYTFSSIPR